MILADTGPVVALNDPGDPYRESVARALTTIRGQELVVPSPVVIEASYFLNRRAGSRFEANLLRQVSTCAIRTIETVLDDYGRAADLVEQYADFPLGTVDALIVAIAERLNVTTIFTLDRRHFSVIRPRHIDAFTVVP